MFELRLSCFREFFFLLILALVLYLLLGRSLLFIIEAIGMLLVYSSTFIIVGISVERCGNACDLIAPTIVDTHKNMVPINFSSSGLGVDDVDVRCTESKTKVAYSTCSPMVSKS